MSINQAASCLGARVRELRHERGLTLKAGRNVLVAKVAQGVGGWGLTARFEGRDGKVLAVGQK